VRFVKGIDGAGVFFNVNVFSPGAARLKSDGLRFMFARLHCAARLHQIHCLVGNNGLCLTMVLYAQQVDDATNIKLLPPYCCFGFCS
jgi:hypothetical protein